MNFFSIFSPLFRKVLEASKENYTKAKIDELVRQAEALMIAKCGGKYLYVPDQSKPLAETRNAKIARDHRNDVSVPDIMSKYGLSRAAVYKILRKQSEISYPKK